MITASMISFLFGAVLGQRFNVVVLVPALAIGLVLSVGAGFAQPQAAWWIIRMAGAGAICLQCGYFAGIIIRHLFTAEPSGGPHATAETSTPHAAP